MNLLNYCFYLILVLSLCLNLSGCKKNGILLPDDEPLEEPQAGEDSLVWTPIKDKAGLLSYGLENSWDLHFDIYSISCSVPDITYDSQDFFWILNYPDTIGELPRRVRFSGEIAPYPYPMLQFDTIRFGIGGAMYYYLRLTDLKTL